MQMPNVPHGVQDSKRKITLTLWAYRKLDENEVAMYAATYVRMHNLKRGKRYDVYLTVE